MLYVNVPLALPCLIQLSPISEGSAGLQSQKEQFSDICGLVSLLPVRLKVDPRTTCSPFEQTAVIGKTEKKKKKNQSEKNFTKKAQVVVQATEIQI